jgi:hypothetical protein
MQAMHQMKLSPFRAAKRTQYRVIQQFPACPKFFFATRNALVHLQNFRRNSGSHLLGRQPSRDCYWRRRSPGWHIPEADHDQHPPALSPALLRRRRRGCLRGTLKALHRSRVSQVQVLQNLARTPLSRRMPAQLRARQPSNRRLNFFLQSLQKRVHAGYLPFWLFRLECCATYKTIPRYHRKDAHEDGQPRPHHA